MNDRFVTAANRLISTQQELGFPMPAIDHEVDTPSEVKWRDTMASILREHFSDEYDEPRPPGNASGSN